MNLSPPPTFWPRLHGFTADSTMTNYANLVLGPLIIGTVFNTFVYGICVLQFSMYWQFQQKDHLIIKLLVVWTFLLDTFHTCALLYMLWVYVVTKFNDPTFLSTVLWPFPSTPIVTTLTSFPIQIYLAWRILRFSHSTMAFLCLVLLSATQASLGFACSIKAFDVPEITSYHTLIPFVDAWQVVAVAADGSITAMLCWYLSKVVPDKGASVQYLPFNIHNVLTQALSSGSDNVIASVIESSIETAAIGAFFCVMDLITFTTLQGTNLNVIFAFPMGRIYTNTLLMTLNSRSSLRAEFEGALLPTIHLEQSSERTNSVALNVN